MVLQYALYLEACRTNEKVRKKQQLKHYVPFSIQRSSQLRPRARAKLSHSRFVLSHERKMGIDPPTSKTQLPIISEIGAGEPDRQFDKKSNCL